MSKYISETVFEKLQSDIFNGKYEIGSRLPPERELAEMFDTSRSTIRDALGRLDHLKLVKRIPQSGTYVMDFKKDAALSLLIHYINNSLDLNPDVLSSFMDFRLVCEIFAVKRSVHNITDKDIAYLTAILDNKTRHISDIEVLAEADLSFHEHIFHLADSLAVQLFFNTLKPVFSDYLKFYYSLNEDPSRILEIQHLLVSALEQRDEELSEFMMKKLLLFGNNRIKEAKLKAATPNMPEWVKKH